MPAFSSLLIDLAVFAVVTLGIFVLGRRMEAGSSVRRRLRGETSPGAALIAGAQTRGIVRAQGPQNSVLRWVQRTTLQDPAERNKLSASLELAGFDHPAAPAIYVVTRFTLAVGLPLAFAVTEKFVAHPLQGLKLAGTLIVLAAIGMIGPRAFIDNRASARRTQLENEFPDCLDLLVICIESGLGLEGAILRVGEETKESHPRISIEFQILSHEMRAGRTRAEALRNLADRTQVEMLQAFVALMIQTDALGGSVSQSLRTYSAEMRQHRMLRAEEKAMRLPVLLTVPLVLFILPVIMTAVMLPPVLEAIRTFLPAIK